MKKSTFLITLLCASLAFAQNNTAAKRKALAKAKADKTAQSQAQARIKKNSAKVAADPLKIYTKTQNSNLRAQLQAALSMAKSGQTQQAANALFSLSRRSELRAEKPQIKYLLGLTLMEMNLNQVASFQFVDVIRMNDSRYKKQALEKLSVVADRLGDETLLNYAVSRIDVSEFPASNKEMLFFRLGEAKLKSGQFSEAANLFSRVSAKSRFYFNALFNKGLAELEASQTSLALRTFNTLLETRSDARVTDTNKVAAQLAIARTYYQKGEFDSAVEAYSRIPRDHVMWHDSVFERTWAMLRSAKFRSALSNYQTLHSAYYEDAYIPESLLSRSIVYLYICKYDEMEKVLSLFENQYAPLRNQITNFIKANSDAEAYYAEMDKAIAIKKGSEEVKAVKLPYKVLKHVLEKGDVRRTFTYLRRLQEEKLRVEEDSSFRATSLGQYSYKIITNRMRNTRFAIGDMTKAHLLNMRVELRDLYEQASFIRYEMINGKKEALKKRISGKDLSEVQIDETVDRKFYIQNGYEYYPFQGEYWLDEIGNYHYLGKQSCE